MFKQLIIARRDLNMSPGKLAAQVSHASIAFLLEKLYWGSKERDGLMYHIGISLDRDLFHNWLIYDACRTELEREGPEGTLTCIGFRPMEAEEIEEVSAL